MNSEIQQKNEQLIELDEVTLLQSFSLFSLSLYQPIYDFVNSEQYKAKLDEIRERQKDMIKDGTATTGAIDWTVDGSLGKGRKMVGDTQKLLLRAFNSECSECEFLTWKVKYNNFESCKKRMFSAYATITKLGKIMSIEISLEYYSLKIEELHVTLEYQLMKQRKKEHHSGNCARGKRKMPPC